MSHYDFSRAYVEMKKAQLEKTNNGKKNVPAEEKTSNNNTAVAPKIQTYGSVIRYYMINKAKKISKNF